MKKNTNKLRFTEDYAEIICVKRDKSEVSFKVDIEDLPILSTYNWVVQSNDSKTSNGEYYAITNIHTPQGKHTTIKMHRLLCPTLPHQYVDHINRDTQDNRKENLRAVDARTNACNSNYKLSSTGIKGVYSRHPGKWYAAINTRLNNKDKIIQTKNYDSIFKASYARYILCVKCMPIIPPNTDMSWQDNVSNLEQQQIYKDVVIKFSRFIIN